MVPRHDPRTTARAFAPIATRSSQGVATTGRYAETPGAMKVLSPYDDPYAYQDSSPLREPEPVSAPTRTTPARDPNADDGYVDTPVGEKQGTVDPRIDAEIRDLSLGIANDVFRKAAIPAITGIVAGYPARKVIPAAIGTALTGAPQTAAAALGYKAINEWAPELYAMARDRLDPNSFDTGRNLDQYRDEAGNLNVKAMPRDQIDATVDSIANRLERSQPLTDQAWGLTKDVASWAHDQAMDIAPGPMSFLDDTVAATGKAARAALDFAVDDVVKPAWGFVDDNVVQPTKNLLGFDDTEEQDTPDQGIDESALGPDAMNPDFALSDYDYNNMMNEEQNMRDMMRKEKERQDKDAKAKADEVARGLIATQFGGYGAGAGFGSKNHLSAGMGGGLGSVAIEGEAARNRAANGGGGFTNTSATSSSGAVGNRTASRGGFQTEDARANRGGGGSRGAGGSSRGGAGNNG